MADRWHCDWCTYSHPVATLVADHQAECVARPSDMWAVAS